MRQITNYTVHTYKSVNLRIDHISDLHNAPYEDVLPVLKGLDMIVVTGDLVNNYTKEFERGIAFLRDAVAMAPTFYSLGNHEGYPNKHFIKIVGDSGAVLLDNRYLRLQGSSIGSDEVTIAGLSEHVSLRMIKAFSKQVGFKLLLCHHPEYYHKYIAMHDIDLTLAGHAHGGQIRLFGQGLYAPGQGWLPKLTNGVHDGRLIINRGASNPVGIPRLFNRCEIVIVNIVSK